MTARRLIKQTLLSGGIQSFDPTRMGAREHKLISNCTNSHVHRQRRQRRRRRQTSKKKRLRRTHQRHKHRCVRVKLFLFIRSSVRESIKSVSAQARCSVDLSSCSSGANKEHLPTRGPSSVSDLRSSRQSGQSSSAPETELAQVSSPTLKKLIWPRHWQQC